MSETVEIPVGGNTMLLGPHFTTPLLMLQKHPDTTSIKIKQAHSCSNN